ncbi:MAG: hypothetical protein Q4D29_03690 [Lachnospiraceae bacterium]|nr:hypothetical protein [Lachnospiraceae bacterium]
MSKIHIWTLTLIIGFICLVSGIVYVLRERKNPNSLYTYAKAAAIEFIAGFILFLPSDFFTGEGGFAGRLQIIEGVFSAFLRTCNILLGEGYSKVECNVSMGFDSIYAIVVITTNILMILFTAETVFLIFSDPLKILRLRFLARENTYIFTEFNDKTVSIAKSISDKYRDSEIKGAKSKNRKKVDIVFICLDADGGVKDKIKELGFICLNMSVQRYMETYASRVKNLEVFLFTSREEENISQLSTICGKISKNFTGTVKIHVEISKTPFQYLDHFMDRYDFGKNRERVFVNFVRMEEYFALNNLLNNSIFEKTYEESQINVLIVGMNERNLEMMKVILYLAQFPGYKLNMMVLDEGQNRNKLYNMMPEVVDEINIPGDAIYRMIYKENVDLSGIDFISLIENEFPNFTLAFVNTGDDYKNIDLALKINAIGIKNRRDGDYIIELNLNDSTLYDLANKEIISNIINVGNLKYLYSYDFITMSDIENISKKIHEIRQAEKHKDESKREKWTDYYNNEYKRRSVYARTLSLIYKVRLIKGDEDYKCLKDDKWKMYEHMRWNMYMRASGYTSALENLIDKDGKLDERYRTLARVHDDITAYENLPEKTKTYDVISVNKDIIDVIKQQK